MGCQTTRLEPPPQADDQPARAIAQGVRHLGHDIVGLLELQYQLGVEDAKAATSGLLTRLIVALVGAVIAVSALPILWISISEGMIRLWDLDRWLAYGIMAVIGLTAGGLAAFLAVRNLGSSFQKFERSKREFSENVRWIKSVLKDAA